MKTKNLSKEDQMNALNELNLNHSEKKRIIGNLMKHRSKKVIVKKNIDIEKALNHVVNKPNLYEVDAQPMRFYPYKGSTSNILGYIGFNHDTRFTTHRKNWS